MRIIALSGLQRRALSASATLQDLVLRLRFSVVRNEASCSQISSVGMGDALL